MKKNNKYPVQYIEPIQLRNGMLVQLRPIHEGDSQYVTAVKNKASKQSLYQRFLGVVTITKDMVKQFTQLDYDRDMAIVAEIKNGDQKEVIGVARLASTKGQKEEVEFAILLLDEWQGQGLGKTMTKYVINIAEELGYNKVTARVFANNKAMLKILTDVGFSIKNEDYQVKIAELEFENNFDFRSLEWLSFKV